jgi:hypothetical protein
VPAENEGVQVIWHEREGQEPEAKTIGSAPKVLHAAAA